MLECIWVREWGLRCYNILGLKSLCFILRTIKAPKSGNLEVAQGNEIFKILSLAMGWRMNFREISQKKAKQCKNTGQIQSRLYYHNKTECRNIGNRLSVQENVLWSGKMATGDWRRWKDQKCEWWSHVVPGQKKKNIQTKLLFFFKLLWDAYISYQGRH